MSILSLARRAVLTEAGGLQTLAAKLDTSFESAARLLLVRGKIVCSGVGKSGHVAAKLAATLTSLGSRAIFLHPTEAAHGDLGVIVPAEDAVLALSRSGSAAELRPLMAFAADHRIPTVLVSERADKLLGGFADVIIRLPRATEVWGHAPTTSTVMQMAVGDALAAALAVARRFKKEDFFDIHPAGDLAGRVEGI